MMDGNERECLERFCPFADGNPRRLKRIINVFNVGRRIVELRRGKKWSGLATFKPKLLKFVIILEQWPYRAPVYVSNIKTVLPPMGRGCLTHACSISIEHAYRCCGVASSRLLLGFSSQEAE